MDLKEMGISTRNWVDSSQDRDYWRALLNAALSLRVPQAMGLVYMQLHDQEYKKLQAKYISVSIYLKTMFDSATLKYCMRTDSYLITVGMFERVAVLHCRVPIRIY